MATLKSRTLGVSIARDPGRVCAFVANLENLPKWATTFCLSIERAGGAWIAQTPQGPVTIRIASRNELGVLDHYVSPSPGVEVYVPMRVVPSGSGSEVLFTLFRRPEMTDAQYAEDQRLVEQDLATLKRVLERGSSAPDTKGAG